MADPVSDTFIITGGHYSIKAVTMYDDIGFLEELPSLNEGRWDHGCAAYLRDDESKSKVYYISPP